MTVREIFVAGEVVNVSGTGYEPKGEFDPNGNGISPGAPLHQLLQAAVLVSDARLVGFESSSKNDGVMEVDWRIDGDPTEGALVVAAAKGGWTKHDSTQSFRASARFRSALKANE